ncbi:hypothetical protein GCM10025865_29270 [Paraoerskovia sediminicola]|uniref:N-acetyltransferase domain-containing protein n=1 Tax=Paraoerskovia sediminicola TaxID=1138587 RepID=A0ABN6XJY4_9CELL|nr:GNAT family N-acetyltransferase [Paraoerskovia sediminicola]BDZ43628.1 hypothetical protein GCM10025865_29270 [Paraoerskovia sediminicola]
MIRTGDPARDAAACVGVWIAAIEARDGHRAPGAVADRARSAFGHGAVRLGVSGAPIAGFALTLGQGAAVLPGPGTASDTGERPPVTRRTALLNYLAVHPSAAGRGLGRALLDDAVEFARQDGYDEIRLEVRPTNAGAVRLYEAAGFARSPGERPHPLDGGPIVEYRRTL